MGFADAFPAGSAKRRKQKIERIGKTLARNAGTKDFRSGVHTAILADMTAPAPEIFNRALYRVRRLRASADTAGDAFLAREAASQIALRLEAVNRRFEKALYLNSRAQGFEALQPCAKTWIHAGSEPASQIFADEEALPFAPESFDLIVSVLSLHAANDLPGALLQIRRALKPDGLFLAALFGGDTLRELRTAFAAAEGELLGGVSPRVALFAGVKDLGGLLQRVGFTLPVADVERTVVRYRELQRLFADLRALGETNVLTARRKAFLSRRLLARLAAEYRALFPDAEGRYPATVEIVYLMGWAPHESQPVPLKPGSAKMRLADALAPKRKEAE
jgi:SAM-dependent methyltransferase